MRVRQVPLSEGGLEVSEFIAGFWRLQHWQMRPAQLQAYLEQLLELGITTMDHAHVYRSEPLFGEVLKTAPGLRERMQIVTKCGIRVPGFGPLGAKNTVHYDSSARAIECSVDQSLADLQIDTIDLLLLHRPDYLMDCQEVARMFAKLKSAGKVRHFGVSNFGVAQLDELHHYWPELATNQVEFSPYSCDLLDQGVFNQCGILGVRPMLWSCLAAGRLVQPNDAKSERIFKVLQQVREATGAHSIEAIVYAWVRQLACAPLPILGTRSIERVKSALEAVDTVLDREHWYQIWEAANGAPVP